MEEKKIMGPEHPKRPNRLETQDQTSLSIAPWMMLLDPLDLTAVVMMMSNLAVAVGGVVERNKDMITCVK
jgi:hypothetical protein